MLAWGRIIKLYMAQLTTTQDTSGYIVGRNSVIVALSVGASVGLFGWLLTLGIHNWVLSPIFCRSTDTAAVCTNSDLTSWIVAYSLLSIVGLFMLIRANIFRPLLVVLAALVTLWAVGLWFISAAWWVGLLWQTGLFALAYALYTWLASIEKFVIASLLIVIIVVLMRLLFVY